MRRLWVLIAHLPADSSYRRVTEQYWTDDLELAAAQVETTYALATIVLRALGSKRVPKPIHVPRPGEPTRRPHRVPISLRDIAADPAVLMGE